MESSSSRGKLFFVIILLAFGAAIFTYYTKNKNVVTAEMRAEQRANLIAQQLIEKQFQIKTFVPSENKKYPNSPSGNPNDSAERALASVDEAFEMNHKVLDGQVGRDPWGTPYGFFVKGDGKHGSTVYIWSVGPNEKPDFKTTKDLIANGANGDDILVVVPF